MSADEERIRRFEEAVLPHLDSAHNLARWLTRSDADAGDVVQEACVRALRHFEGFRGGDAKPWFLAVVRNTALTWLSHRPKEVELNEERALPGTVEASSETELLRFDEREVLNRALELLPAEFREAIVLRELEGMAYKEISAALGVPIGTVMSRLARGRKLLLASLGGARGDRS